MPIVCVCVCVCVTGTYVLQTKRIKFYRDESESTCLLCGNAEETIQHFILDCQKLESERTKILMKISATYKLSKWPYAEHKFTAISIPVLLFHTCTY
jgi:hypothetical protein